LELGIWRTIWAAHLPAIREHAMLNTRAVGLRSLPVNRDAGHHRHQTDRGLHTTPPSHSLTTGDNLRPSESRVQDAYTETARRVCPRRAALLVGDRDPAPGPTARQAPASMTA